MGSEKFVINKHPQKVGRKQKMCCEINAANSKENVFNNNDTAIKCLFINLLLLVLRETRFTLNLKLYSVLF